MVGRVAELEEKQVRNIEKPLAVLDGLIVALIEDFGKLGREKQKRLRRVYLE